MEEVIQHILLHSHGLTREEVVIAIEKKKTASGGFLTNEAAARLVAAEYGVGIKLKKALPKICIHQLVSGLNDVTVSGRVLLVNMPQTFPKINGSGQIARLLIADKTGIIKVVLWNDKAELARKVQLRNVVKVMHGYVRRGKDGEIELHVGQRGDMQIAPSEVRESDFPLIKEFCVKIADITETQRRVNVEGKIRILYPVTVFHRRDGIQSKVMRILLKDETGQVLVVFWNDRTDQVAKLKEGVAILLMNARSVKNQHTGLLELHVGDSSNMEVLPCVESSYCVEDLKEGMRIAYIEGTIATEPVFRKVSTRKGETVSVASFELRDNTGKVWVTAWREHAKKIEGITIGAKISLKNVKARKGFGNQIEITTRASTQIETQR